MTASPVILPRISGVLGGSPRYYGARRRTLEETTTTFTGHIKEHVGAAKTKMTTSTMIIQIEPHQPALLGAEVIAPAETSTKDCLKKHMKSMCESFNRNEEEQSFFMADLGEIYRQHRRWERNLKKVKPFYGMHPNLQLFLRAVTELWIAVKANPDAVLLRLLASLGTGFDCASRGEIELVLGLGVEPSRIIYAHPCKPNSHIRLAQRKGLKKMTYDSIDELLKIKAIFPDAELILRILTDDSSSHCPFQDKFGAPLNYVSQLFQTASTLGLNVIGVSFHIGSGATDPLLFVKAVQDSRSVFNVAKEFGFYLKVLDVGGGFSDRSFEAMSKTLMTTLDNEFPRDVHFVAEPGRFYVATALTLACNIIARRDIRQGSRETKCMLFLSDGIYGSFLDTALYGEPRQPSILFSAIEEATETPMEYSLWGPTCDGIDRIMKLVYFHKALNVGDWLYFPNMGAYAASQSTNFNGFSNKLEVFYVSSEPEAMAFLQQWHG